MFTITRCFEKPAIIFNDSALHSACLTPAIVNVAAKHMATKFNQLNNWRKLAMSTLSTSLLNVIDKPLFARAEQHDSDALFQIGIIHLQHNRAGFAKAFLQHAAKIGHQIAKKYVSILEDRKLPVKDRIEAILNNC
jgi:hypothetical protein